MKIGLQSRLVSRVGEIDVLQKSHMPIWTVFCLALSLVIFSLNVSVGRAADPQTFAGSASCSGCHEAETNAWQGSDHGWALREPTAQNVLGDFSGVTFTNKDVTSRFFMKDGQYFVQTDGADGKPQDYQVRFTVGVRPLQQYLVETADGRLQVLDTAWDAVQGKWYHLYPDQEAGARNGMHWSGAYKNWQARCAQCHQTGFEKNFDAQAHNYKSHWAELTVSCESCHGPSADHVAWARQSKKGSDVNTTPPPATIGLGINQQANELAVCGPCHARREAYSQNNAPVGATTGDHFGLSLLNDGLYFADGQQDAEVFVLGSFLQSKMMAKGVSCSNCHEPHSNGLVAEGNAVCTQCHSEAGHAEFPSLKKKVYDAPSHHHHQQGSEAAQCITCHMPSRDYMVIDGRRDHFFRMPQPLQSKAAGSPDACTGCHNDKDAGWAASNIAQWSPEADYSWQDRTPFVAFHNGDRSQQTLEALSSYALDLERPAIVRATAVGDLRDGAGPQLRVGLLPLLQDDNSLVRTAAAGLFRDVAPVSKWKILKPLLTDPVRSVRQAAAKELAGSDPTGQSQADLAALQTALGEYQASRAANADMPESQMAIAGLALSMRDWQAAEAAFNAAAAMDPQLSSSWLMLARLRSALGDEPAAASYLEKGLASQPRSLDLMFERAGLETRRGDDKRAVDWYRRIIAIDDTRTDAWLEMAYAALRIQDAAIALDAATKVLSLEPDNAQAMVAKAYAHYGRGETDKARESAQNVRQLAPEIQLPPELETLLKN